MYNVTTKDIKISTTQVFLNSKPKSDWDTYVLDPPVQVRRGWTWVFNWEASKVTFYNSKGRLVKTVKVRLESCFDCEFWRGMCALKEWLMKRNANDVACEDFAQTTGEYKPIMSDYLRGLV